MDTRSLAGGNLPLAVGFLPAPVRSHLCAIGVFVAALAADPVVTGAARLDRLERGLGDLAAGRRPEDPVLDGLLPTVRAYALPVDVLRGMVAAARSERQTRSYETFEQLLASSRRVADPPGELALRVLGRATVERLDLYRFISTGTRLLGHVLTAAVDWRAGSRYLPVDDLERFGVRGGEPAGQSGWRRVGLLGLQAERARALLESGAPLVSTMRGRQRFAVAVHLARCRVALALLERSGYDLGAWPRPPAAAVMGRWAYSVVSSAG